MVGTKITQPMDGRHKNNSQRDGRMESYMVSMKITRPRDRQHKNNSPKRWMDGELYDRHENKSPKYGELNSRHENNSPKGLTAQK